MKIGIVLAGGGARGAYQIGVWKALKELKIDKHINVISGTSIGALNAMLFMQGDVEKAEELWYSITKEKILPTDNKDLLTRGILVALGSKNMNFVKKYMPKTLEAGNISRSGLVDILNEYIDFNEILKSKITCYVTCTEVPELVPRYFKIDEYNLETVKSILLATSALPMIYECEKVQDKQYLDGGMVDNVPIQPIYGEGCDIIIVVKLSKNSIINKRMYPNTKFIELAPSFMDEGFVDGVLDFTSDSAKKRVKLGYEDTIEYIKPLFELFNFIDSYNREELKKNEIIENKNKKMLLSIIKSKILGREGRYKDKEVK